MEFLNLMLSIVRIAATIVLIFLATPIQVSAQQALLALDHLPLSHLAEWTYRTNQGRTITARAYERTGTSAGRKLFLLRKLESGDSQLVSNHPTHGIEIHQETYDNGRATLLTPMCVVPRTIRAGSECRSSGQMDLTVFGQGTFRVDFTSTATVSGMQTINTQAGRFETAKISVLLQASGTIQGTQISESSRTTWWLAKDVGPVRTSESDGVVATLTGYSVDLDLDGLFAGVPTSVDNCPLVASSDRRNDDDDEFGNVCDNCPKATNADQADSDGDTLGDACDRCPNDATNECGADEVCFPVVAAGDRVSMVCF